MASFFALPLLHLIVLVALVRDVPGLSICRAMSMEQNFCLAEVICTKGFVLRQMESHRNDHI